METSLEKVKAWPQEFKAYVNELKLEMRRVTWPNRKQVESTTIVVILTVFAFAAYFQIVDEIFNKSIAKITQVFTR